MQVDFALFVINTMPKGNCDFQGCQVIELSKLDQSFR